MDTDSGANPTTRLTSGGPGTLRREDAEAPVTGTGAIAGNEERHGVTPGRRGGSVETR